MHMHALRVEAAHVSGISSGRADEPRARHCPCMHACMHASPACACTSLAGVVCPSPSARQMHSRCRVTCTAAWLFMYAVMCDDGVVCRTGCSRPRAARTRSWTRRRARSRRPRPAAASSAAARWWCSLRWPRSSSWRSGGTGAGGRAGTHAYVRACTYGSGMRTPAVARGGHAPLPIICSSCKCRNRGRRACVWHLCMGGRGQEGIGSTIDLNAHPQHSGW